jgi:hypothetical protein
VDVAVVGREVDDRQRARLRRGEDLAAGGRRRQRKVQVVNVVVHLGVVVQGGGSVAQGGSVWHTVVAVCGTRW